MKHDVVTVDTTEIPPSSMLLRLAAVFLHYCTPLVFPTDFLTTLDCAWPSFYRMSEAHFAVFLSPCTQHCTHSLLLMYAEQNIVWYGVDACLVPANAMALYNYYTYCTIVKYCNTQFYVVH